jgi:hypothetical protein
MITTVAWRTSLVWAAAFLPLWAAIAGRCCGDDMMGMQIDSVDVQAQTTTVTTTGTQFVLDQAQNQILCYQRIPKGRQVATISGLSLSGLTLQSLNAQQCVLNTQQGSFTIGADGLMTMSMGAAVNFGITGNYEPAYQGKEYAYNGTICKDLFLPDAIGGIAVYNGGGVDLAPPAAWNSGWTVNCQANANSKLRLSVFPPRPFDTQQANQTVVQSFSAYVPYPSDQQISAWSKVGTVLALPGYIWQGTAGGTYGVEDDECWGTTTFTPKNASELCRVVTTAHDLGVKVLAAMSPLYFGDVHGNAKPTTMPAYLEQVQRVVSTYGIDGLYMDGIYTGDVAASVEVMQRLRQIVGNSGILYLHETKSPFASMPCPVIDAYATYTLRGEHVKLDMDNADDAAYARWFLSDYNLGNAVGMFCYDYRSNGEASTRALDEMQDIIDVSFQNNSRIPYWGDTRGVPDHVPEALTDAEKALLNLEYFPRLVAPEPSATSLLGMGVLGALIYVWRERRKRVI